MGEAENILPYGLPYDRRASRLIEALEIIRLLWGTIDPVSLPGRASGRSTRRSSGAEPYGDAPPADLGRRPPPPGARGHGARWPTGGCPCSPTRPSTGAALGRLRGRVRRGRPPPRRRHRRALRVDRRGRGPGDRPPDARQHPHAPGRPDRAGRGLPPRRRASRRSRRAGACSTTSPRGWAARRRLRHGGRRAPRAARAVLHVGHARRHRRAPAGLPRGGPRARLPGQRHAPSAT